MVKLKKGDSIGVISPSAPITAFCPNRFNRGIAYLEKIGYKTVVADNAREVKEFTAGTIQQRVADVHEMFANKDVKAIILTIGGYNANDLLDKLDYEMIKKNNNKLLIGYSDATVLLHAMHCKSGVKGIMGPMILPQFAEFPEMNKFTLDSFNDVVKELGSGKEYTIPVSDKYTEEMLVWDKEDNRPRKMKKNSGLYIVKKGVAKGKLIPANLNTFCKLIGTPYMPNLRDAILFLEDDSDESIATIQRMLQHFKQADLLNEIRGIVFGRFQAKSKISRDGLKTVLNSVFNDIKFPVIGNADFGHTDPVISLPIGNDVRIDTVKKEIVITL